MNPLKIRRLPKSDLVLIRPPIQCRFFNPIGFKAVSFPCIWEGTSGKKRLYLLKASFGALWSTSFQFVQVFYSLMWILEGYNDVLRLPKPKIAALEVSLGFLLMSGKIIALNHNFPHMVRCSIYWATSYQNFNEIQWLKNL